MRVRRVGACDSAGDDGLGLFPFGGGSGYITGLFRRRAIVTRPVESGQNERLDGDSGTLEFARGGLLGLDQ